MVAVLAVLAFGSVVVRCGPATASESTANNFGRLALGSEHAPDNSEESDRTAWAGIGGSRIGAWEALVGPEVGRRPTSEGVAPNTTTVYRVESPGNARLDIGPGGEVVVKGDSALFLNFGDEARALSTQASRLESGFDGTVVKAFEVPTSFVDELRAASVPESLARSFPNAPFRVDTRYADQFGLRSCSFAGLADAIVPGSGRIC